MIFWPIKACRDSDLFSEIIVSTEDREIADFSSQFGARVVERPMELSGDDVHEGRAHNHVLDTLDGEGNKPDYFLVIYPTAVLVSVADLVASEKMMVSDPRLDVVMSMSAYVHHPYKAFIADESGFWKPMFPDKIKMQTQTYPKALAVNGTFCWCRTEAWRKNMHYFPVNFSAYEMPHERATDIDTGDDYNRAVRLFQQYKEESNGNVSRKII